MCDILRVAPFKTFLLSMLRYKQSRWRIRIEFHFVDVLNEIVNRLADHRKAKTTERAKDKLRLACWRFFGCFALDLENHTRQWMNGLRAQWEIFCRYSRSCQLFLIWFESWVRDPEREKFMFIWHRFEYQNKQLRLPNTTRKLGSRLRNEKRNRADWM